MMSRGGRDDKQLGKVSQFRNVTSLAPFSLELKAAGLNINAVKLFSLYTVKDDA